MGRKALKRKLGKKVLAATMTVDEARARLGCVVVQKSYGAAWSAPPEQPPAYQPRTVQVVLSGAAPDLIKVVIFLDRVTVGDSPADILCVLQLNAIRIVSESGRSHRVTLTLQLEEAGR